jgi:hypothetical protein
VSDSALSYTGESVTAAGSRVSRALLVTFVAAEAAWIVAIGFLIFHFL